MPESRFDNSGRVANLLNLSTSLRATPIYLGRSQKTVDGGSAGQIIVVGRATDERLHQRIIAEQLGVVAVLIATENVVDLLSEQFFGGVRDVVLISRVGHPPRGLGEPLIEQTGRVSDRAV